VCEDGKSKVPKGHVKVVCEAVVQGNRTTPKYVFFGANGKKKEGWTVNEK
jgi:hypothetical protein